MKVRIEESDKFFEIFPDGFISVETMDVFEKAISTLIQKNKNIIINFKDTGFIDSSSIGLLLMNMKTAKNNGLKIIFINLNNSVRQTFTIIGLISSLTIAADHDEAVTFASS